MGFALLLSVLPVQVQGIQVRVRNPKDDIRDSMARTKEWFMSASNVRRVTHSLPFSFHRNDSKAILFVTTFHQKQKNTQENNERNNIKISLSLFNSY